MLVMDSVTKLDILPMAMECEQYLAYEDDRERYTNTKFRLWGVENSSDVSASSHFVLYYHADLS